ncbi:MAG: hypothetical protein ACJAXW_003390 [Candidatus Azotimanducaceae bacterium]|jgi:hypothetical protein
MTYIQNLSRILRWLVWLFPIGAAVLLITGGLGPVTATFGNEVLASAWQAGPGSEPGLTIFMALNALLLLTSVFWISQLFKTFSRGVFFDAPVVTCFVWLGWLYFTSFLLDQALSIYAYYFLKQEDIAFDIRAGQICMMVLLLIVVHILRAASRLQQENESFI